MKNQVVILKDDNGNYYIVGVDVLDQTRVQTEEHIKLLDSLLNGRKPNSVGSIGNIELTSLGEIDVKEDRFLQLSYSPPQYVVGRMPSNPS